MKAVAWMAGALVSFSLIAVGARELSGAIPVFESLFVRTVIGFALVVSAMAAMGTLGQIRSQRLGLHITRNLIHFGGQYGWFVGIGLLPLAEVFALEFTVPVWTALIAALTLKETLTGRTVVAIALGLAGVMVIVRPGVEIIDTASLLVLASAVCYALSHTATKAMSTTESPFNILFYMCLVQLPIGFVLALPNWLWPEGIQWFWLAVLGIAGMTGHYCMAAAMAHADVTKVVTLDFLRLPLIAVVGVLFYAEDFDLFLLMGGGLMLLGNLVNSRGRRPALDN